MNKCILMIAAALLFAACNPKTELAVKNSSNSDGTINDIVWQDSSGAADATWNEDVAVSDTSSSKEVSETNGKIVCAVLDESTSMPYLAIVDIEGESGASTTLNSGESQVVTVTATSSGTPASKASLK